MSESLISLLSVSLGATIAAIIGYVTTKQSTRSDRKKELMALAVNAGIEAFKADREFRNSGEKAVLPMSFYIFFHYNFLHLAERGKVDKAAIESLQIKQAELLETVQNGPWGVQFISNMNQTSESEHVADY